jgi:hypothetical protein
VTWLWWAGTTLPFGFLTPILFAAAAAKVKKPSWYRWAALYAVGVYGGLAGLLIGADGTDLDGGGALLMVVAWVAGMGHAFAARFEYARALAGPEPAVDRAREIVKRREEAQRLALREPQVARQMGVGRPDLPGATDMGVIDVNHAGASAIATLPGVDDALAQEIVRAREACDGFKTLAEMGGVLDLEADTVETLRPYAVFLPR